MGPMRSSYIALHGDEAVVAQDGGRGALHDPRMEEVVVVLQVSNLQWPKRGTRLLQETRC